MIRPESSKTPALRNWSERLRDYMRRIVKDPLLP